MSGVGPVVDRKLNSMDARTQSNKVFLISLNPDVASEHKQSRFRSLHYRIQMRRPRRASAIGVKNVDDVEMHGIGMRFSTKWRN